MEYLVGFFVAIIAPLIFIVAIYQFDFYQTGQFRTVLVSLILGGIAYAPSSSINRILTASGLTDKITLEYFIAPVHEELFKGLLLIYLVSRSHLIYSVDGVLYGFAIGVGFAIFENFEELLQGQLAIGIVSRVFSTNLVHAFSSATVGIAFGISRLKESRLRWWIPVAGFFLAIGQHMLYNIIIHTIYSMGMEINPVVTFLPGLVGGIFVYVVMIHGKNQARNWIKEKLGMDDRVTRSEVAAIDRFAGTDDIMLPIVERFGVEKAKQVEKLLYLQARIGIKKKFLDNVRNNRTPQNAIESEINEMRTKMEQIRRSIGTYAMLFVRGLFTEEMVSVWERVQVKIQERSAGRVGQIGGGLWSSLEGRIKSPTENEGVD
ncbi:MAG: PrsW family glutamic-type intramembrane protease [Anaerolineales bacterium]|jgi:RsiW-degrading membrane proteinase PrsW (M82 family)